MTTLLLTAAVIEGAAVYDEPIVEGVECDAEVVEGVVLAADALGE